MYVSSLLINVGDNPDRPRPGRLWLRNLYHVHQRLCMAFPTPERISDDQEFLKPFNPGDFGNGQVHVQRNEDSGFLFRIDPGLHGRAVILVQSAAKPNWDYAFHNARYLLAAEPELREFVPHFEEGRRLRFCLVANPTRRLSKHSLGPDGHPVAKLVGKRVPVPADRLLDWLADWRVPPGRDEDAPGFTIDRQHTTATPGYVYWKKDGKSVRLFSVRYEGILEVTEAEKFSGTLARGIGPSKAFGFGLLSVLPRAASP